MGRRRRSLVFGVWVFVLLITLFSAVLNVPVVGGSGTIYIKADGSIDPPTAPIQRNGDVYNFTDNIYDSIVVERDNIVIDGAGYTVKGIGAWNSTGILLSERSNVTINNMQVKNFRDGIKLSKSLNNVISGNNIAASNYSGISLYDSSNNSICRNSIFGNNIANSQYGILLIYSPNNSISENNIASNWWGIQLSDSSNNSISGNNIASNWWGILLYKSSSNIFFHNNFIASFINNTEQLDIQGFVYANVWDDGYPSGGNYWNDYGGVDLYGGPYQNVTGSDGIGDTPYVIDANSRDGYPLMNPWPTPLADFSITAPPTLLTIQQGNSSTSVVRVTSMGGFNQLVQLTVSGVPSGVTATLNPEQVTPPSDGTTNSTLTISVTTTATPGNYTLTVTGTNGTLTHSVKIPFKVTTQQSVGGFLVWVLGAAIAALATAVAATLLLRKRKKTSLSAVNM